MQTKQSQHWMWKLNYLQNDEIKSLGKFNCSFSILYKTSKIKVEKYLTIISMFAILHI